MSFDKRNELIEDALIELEFYEVLKIISKYSYSENTASQILNLKPLKSKDLLDIEFEYLSEMINLIEKESIFSLDGLIDISTLLNKSKIINSVLTVNEILDFLDFIVLSRNIENYFQQFESNYSNLKELAFTLKFNKSLEKLINSIIDENGNIKDNASVKLKRIREEIKEKSFKVRDRITKILAKTIEDDVAQDEFITVREDRFVIPIKVSNKRTYAGIIHGISNTGQTVFLEPQEIVDMNNEISLLKNEEKREIYRLLELITVEISKEADLFLLNLEILTKLDFIKSKAHFSIDYRTIKPLINTNNIISLRNVKHPLLIKKFGREKVIPLSIEIEKETNGFVISGPNAGGKTVALKTIGLSILMTLSGIFPVGEVNTFILDIFSSIGDHQSIENDLSTFSSQILRIKEILEFSAANDLVLIDEICSGTDPQEGSALACGIMDTMQLYKIFFIVTTHQSFLKNYALNIKNIKNASLEFDEINLKPSYKFLSGIPGNSYAFNLAENVGLNTEIIKRAEKYTFSGQLDLEKSISELNRIKKETELIKIETEKQLKNAQNSEINYQTKLKEINSQKSQLIQNARNEAAFIVKEANRLIENKIREIEEQKKSVQTIKQEFESEKEKIVSLQVVVEEKPTFNKEDLLDGDIGVGDSVLMQNSDSIGKVLEIDGDVANVDFNGLKFKVKIGKLIKTRPPKAEKKSTYAEYITFSAQSSIDIRGMRVEEAIVLIDKQISESITSNNPYLTILHGKGTGALRMATKSLLENHHLVKKFREGKLEEGGAGVTIVEF